MSKRKPIVIDCYEFQRFDLELEKVPECESENAYQILWLVYNRSAALGGDVKIRISFKSESDRQLFKEMIDQAQIDS